MRDAIGGTVVIAIVIFFIVLVNGYLAFNVNYTKAFNVKSQIVSIIEKNDGYDTEVEDLIKSYIIASDYSPNKDLVDSVIDNNNLFKDPLTGDPGDDYTCSDFGYCVKKITSDNNGENSNRGVYYQVVTFVSMDIPLLGQLLPFLASDLFLIEGETRLISVF